MLDTIASARRRRNASATMAPSNVSDIGTHPCRGRGIAVDTFCHCDDFRVRRRARRSGVGAASLDRSVSHRVSYKPTTRRPPRLHLPPPETHDVINAWFATN